MWDHCLLLCAEVAAADYQVPEGSLPRAWIHTLLLSAVDFMLRSLPMTRVFEGMELYQRVQAQRMGGHQARTRTGSAETVSLVAGLAECPACGGTMTRVYKGKGGGRPRLVCVRAKKKLNQDQVYNVVIGVRHVDPYSDEAMAPDTAPQVSHWQSQQSASCSSPTTTTHPHRPFTCSPLYSGDLGLCRQQ